MNDLAPNPTGLSLELVVTKIQQMMDAGSQVTHNEKLVDRVGNKRQYDVVVRGNFGGRPVLGVIECKDHSRKVGPNLIEAFAKKTENLGANLRLVVSRRGFTAQALKLAKHENIGCLSLLPDNPEQVGFGIGDTWYGVIESWTPGQLRIYFADKKSRPSLRKFDSSSVKWQGKPVMNWFQRELFTTYRDEEPAQTGEALTLTVEFEEPRNIEVEGKEYILSAISCQATKTRIKKKKWVSWSGDAFLDWHTNQFTIPADGKIVGSPVEGDLREWDDYDGELPDIAKSDTTGFLKAVIYSKQKWDESLNESTPDLSSL